MISINGMFQIAAADQAHRVIGRVSAGAFYELVDGNDAWVLELAGDPGLVHEAGMEAAFNLAVGPQFLEGDFATKFIVAGDPDLPDAALGMEPQQGIALAGLWLIGSGRIAGWSVGVLLAHDTPPSAAISEMGEL